MNYRTKLLANKHPKAPSKLIAGVRFLLLPCEWCKYRVWTNAHNDRCLCDNCCGPNFVDISQREPASGILVYRGPEFCDRSY